MVWVAPLTALLEESKTETPAGRLYADSLIQTLTLHLLKNYSDAAAVQENLNGGLSGYKLRRVQEFINANLEEDLSLAELAEVANLSQFHFARAFRKSTGQATSKSPARPDGPVDCPTRHSIDLPLPAACSSIEGQSSTDRHRRALARARRRRWRRPDARLR